MKFFNVKTLLSMALIAGVALSLSQAAIAYPGEYERDGHHHREHINPRDIDGKIKIVNDTDFDLYATCDGVNLGKVDRHSSEEFWTKCGEQYVVVEVEDCRASKDVRISPHRRYGRVRFSESDFMRLPERKR